MARSEQLNKEMREASTRRILKTALRLFAAHGYAGTSIRMIAESAGISVGLLYNYFPSKADLGRRLIERYLALRDTLFGAGGLAFVDTAGAAVTAEAWPGHLAGLRRVWINTEFNGALCRGLLAARFGEEAPEPDGEPTLADFIRRARRESCLPHPASERGENAQDHVA